MRVARIRGVELSYLEKGKGTPVVLVNGAGGCTGMFAVQLAELYGAEVTGVDNTGKLGFMRSLGAERVVYYTQQDFTKNETAV